MPEIRTLLEGAYDLCAYLSTKYSEAAMSKNTDPGMNNTKVSKIFCKV